MALPPLAIDPQVSAPVPPGLFSVASGPLDMPEHAQNNGAIWVPDTCGLGEVSAAPCKTPPYTAFVMDNLDAIAQAWPFTVYATLNTGPFGFDNDEAVRRVRARLGNTEQYVCEHVLSGDAAFTALFTGAGAIDNYAGTQPGVAPAAGVAGGIFQQIANIGSAAGFFDLGTATDVKTAVGLLEQSAADHYYGQAVLHARARIAAYAGAAGQFRVIGLPPSADKTYMYTNNLNLWNFGNGYTGVGPTNQAPDATTEYIWATGRVIVWRSPDVWISPPDQLLNRNTNQRGLYAIRQYMIGVECFAACVKVTR